MKMKKVLLIFGSIIFAFILCFINLNTLASASMAGQQVLYVAPNNDCGAFYSPCYSQIQDAVDAAIDGDTILVAAGVYSKTNSQLSPPDYNIISGDEIVTQVVYITKSISIYGGYTKTNWITSDPINNPTTLDAENLGRTIFAMGDINLSFENLQLIGGSAVKTGLYGFSGRGGGAFIKSATLDFNNNVVHANFASESGGGLYVVTKFGEIISNSIQSNFGSGAHIYPYPSTGEQLLFKNNLISENQGEGLYINACLSCVESDSILGEIVISHNNIMSNTNGGIVARTFPTLTIDSNIIEDNTSSIGGGLVLRDGLGVTATVKNNVVFNNHATDNGGGVWLRMRNYDAILSNNVVLENTSDGNVGGILVERDDDNSPIFPPVYLVILHSTISLNSNIGIEFGLQQVCDHCRILQTNAGTPSLGADIINTIVANQTTGVNVKHSGIEVSLQNTLWFNNITNTATFSPALGLLNTTNDFFGNPAFDADGYHVTEASEAKNRGVLSFVHEDIDGDFRIKPDIGADEWPTNPIYDFYVPFLSR